ncbi:hypothetical protein SPI_00724 [Niveomyces insectorum RCEF 264]|uniref:Uncharacterized protein n=1 Tax=Niveomyces insectorum RCEF 264 TaxID=1081102 RepID=A0A162MQJ4_9HYPO|nr:hypothetical protein SPI_00724 [Niveomyces insectorum RCEF 264]
MDDLEALQINVNEVAYEDRAYANRYLLFDIDVADYMGRGGARGAALLPYAQGNERPVPDQRGRSVHVEGSALTCGKEGRCVLFA